MRRRRYYLYNVKVLGEMASALYGPNSTDAAAYRYYSPPPESQTLGVAVTATLRPINSSAFVSSTSTLYEQLVLQFNSVFYNPNDHTYDTPLQTSAFATFTLHLSWLSSLVDEASLTWTWRGHRLHYAAMAGHGAGREEHAGPADEPAQRHSGQAEDPPVDWNPGCVLLSLSLWARLSP
jgi:hypothetical protein